MANNTDLLRNIPSIDSLLADPLLDSLRNKYSENLVKSFLRRTVENLRKELLKGSASEADCSHEAIAKRAEDLAEAAVGRKLRRVINGAGVIVHTNLGRSCLSQTVVNRIAEAARTYSNLEYNLQKGKRGERNSHLGSLMAEITGAESALAVNNNAAAVLLALTGLAYGKEVIVSRGELIEIGGSFRIPDIMKQSGAVLREVGTTNRTHPKDYIQAINENTALILKVHTSNYRIIGFTREVSLEELVAIGRDHNLPTMMDLGSGSLVDLSPYGLLGETTVQEVLATGIDVVSFSGDKLLGGPQAGILAGKSESIEKMRTHPLARALRMDKLTLAGLEATLEEYTRPEGPFGRIPTLTMIAKTAEELTLAAESLAKAVREKAGKLANISIEQGAGRVGGGALPENDLPGPRVSIRPLRRSAAVIEQKLRLGNPPVILLVKDDACLIDPRTLLEQDFEDLPNLIYAALSD
jgi:L-seryl-tRNA(Ser) seleniumtransferase